MIKYFGIIFLIVMKKKSTSKKTLSIIFLSSFLLTSIIAFPMIQSTTSQNNIDTFTAIGEWDYGEDDYRKHLNTEWSCEDPNNCSDQELYSLLPTYSVPTEIWDPIYQAEPGKETWYKTEKENGKHNGTRRTFFYYYLDAIGLEASATKYFKPGRPGETSSEWFVDETKFEEIILEFIFPTSNPFKIPWIYSSSEWFNDLDDSYGLSIEMDGVLYDKTAYEENSNRPKEEYIFEYEKTYMLIDDSKYGTADKWSVEIVEDRSVETQFIATNSIKEWEWEISQSGTWPTFYEIITENVGENIQLTISNKTENDQYIYTISSHPDDGLWANGWWGILMSYGLSPLNALDEMQGFFNQAAKLPLKHIRVPLKKIDPNGVTIEEWTYEAGMPEVFLNSVYPYKQNIHDIEQTTFESKFLSWPKSPDDKKYSDFSNTARVLDFPKQEEIPFDKIVVSENDKVITIILISWASLMIVGGISLIIFSKVKHNAMVSYYDKKTKKSKGSK